MHLYLSPHSDDAALSCGGHIAQLTRRGERVVIFTVMAGDPPLEFRPTPFVEKLHAEWGLGDNPVPGRHREDEAAAQALGAEIKFGPYPDAVYRVHTDTHVPLYSDRDAIFDKIHPDDPVMQAKRAAVVQAIVDLFDLKPGDAIHVPLGVGKHVDHQVVREIGKSLARWRPDNPMYFYEEFPYTRGGEAAVKAARDALEMPVTVMTHLLDPEAIDARINAIRCYKSQITALDWADPVAMAYEVRTAIARFGGEREWRLLYAADALLT
ncbi:MAG: PIG-L family deacetylase [Anaerolineae bacterium]|nr:PIG-L family deacetylase [Anaerolineae bacterium]